MIELAVVFILGMLASLIANDVSANVNSICNWLVRLAVRQAPRAKRARLQEEWMADVDETAGTVPKLFAVAGFFVAAFKLRLHSSSVAETSNETDELLCRNLGLLRTVDVLDLSRRSAQWLKNHNIVHIGDLIQMTEGELLRMPNFGRRSLNEIKEALAEMGLHLGMEVPNWPPENIEELTSRRRPDGAAAKSGLGGNGG